MTAALGHGGILGIDLGTSSVKLLYTDRSGRSIKCREPYDEISTDGWYNALCAATGRLKGEEICAVGLSSQVGTYIVNGKDVISWSDPVGGKQLERVLSHYSRITFLQEISMPHPKILSYPLPRLRYIRLKNKRVDSVCMPKDFLIQKLCGKSVTDPFSWRGLCNLKFGHYSQMLLQETGIDASCLPEIVPVQSVAGIITQTAAKQTGLPAGIPVYTGCNDFFAGLLGMGVLENGSLFDITGTSEHLGIITSNMTDTDDGLICGPYFQNYVHYGVTASSGRSLQFATQLDAHGGIDPAACLAHAPPIFLPYLNGERAPVWDEKAKGVFFGIGGETSKKELAWAVMEGVVFSLYHIYQHMGRPRAKSITVAGGAAGNDVLNRLKASLFGLPVITLCENDVSVLGAQMIAAVGEGWYADLHAAAKECVKPAGRLMPDPSLKKLLLKRFALYRRLYPALKQSFEIFDKI